MLVSLAHHHVVYLTLVRHLNPNSRTDNCKPFVQAYVHELGQCLLKLDGDKDGTVAQRLLLLSVEGMRLVGRRLLQNPAAHKALISANLVQGQPTLLHLDADFYINLLVGLAHVSLLMIGSLL